MVIKKLNSMFHRHGRWLFAVITVVIIISFLGFLTPGQFGMDGMFSWGGRAVGVAYGKKVTDKELRSEMTDMSVFRYFYIGQGEEIKPEEAFWSVCLNRAAALHELTVSDKEVADLIAASPALQTDYKFDIARYKDMLGRASSHFGIAAADVERAYRKELLKIKLRQDFLSGSAVTDHELEQMYRRINAAHKVAALSFAGDDFKAKVDPTEAELKAFFSGNRAAYSIEAKASGLLFVFPFDNYTAAATAEATPAAAKELYTKSPQLFAVDGKTPAYEKIAGKVREKLIELKSADMARIAAYDFSEKAYNALLGQPAANRLSVMNSLAAEYKIKPLVINSVSETSEKVAGVTLPRMAALLCRAAVGNNPVTDIVSGARGAYIGVGISGSPAHNAEFPEVADRVKVDFAANAATTAARNAATKAADALSKLADGPARLKAMSKLGGKLTEFEFSGEKLPPAGMERAAYAATTLREGENSAMMPTSDGAVVTLLEKRTPPDMSGFKAKASRYENLLRQYKAELAAQGFQERLLQNCHLYTDNGARN
ncbi:MAG: SurA N-terminal domain-containing protein [Victivallaceae bacterium]|nr:SurA N-terminal domain-containing protein [Victivallaceae bacterium]